MEVKKLNTGNAGKAPEGSYNFSDRIVSEPSILAILHTCLGLMFSFCQALRMLNVLQMQGNVHERECSNIQIFMKTQCN
jgi:hypothetical protein